MARKHKNARKRYKHRKIYQKQKSDTRLVKIERRLCEMSPGRLVAVAEWKEV